ncbi:hypothetical protein F5884DRAFT_862418 [Xylogone sp. PMI_703]|nr:hypothetical protein F5884DRAFT_862418 [Xylogone sp. PMI_703]
MLCFDFEKYCDPRTRNEHYSELGVAWVTVTAEAMENLLTNGAIPTFNYKHFVVQDFVFKNLHLYRNKVPRWAREKGFNRPWLTTFPESTTMCTEKEFKAMVTQFFYNFTEQRKEWSKLADTGLDQCSSMLPANQESASALDVDYKKCLMGILKSVSFDTDREEMVWWDSLGGTIRPLIETGFAIAITQALYSSQRNANTPESLQGIGGAVADRDHAKKRRSRPRRMRNNDKRKQNLKNRSQEYREATKKRRLPETFNDEEAQRIVEEQASHMRNTIVLPGDEHGGTFQRTDTNMKIVEENHKHGDISPPRARDPRSASPQRSRSRYSYRARSISPQNAESRKPSASGIGY